VGLHLYQDLPKDRNAFRSTASHNTPCIDGEEVNRFIAWDYLWQLHNDATPSGAPVERDRRLRRAVCLALGV
jgi:hypothetical protein